MQYKKKSSTRLIQVYITIANASKVFSSENLTASQFEHFAQEFHGMVTESRTAFPDETKNKI